MSAFFYGFGLGIWILGVMLSIVILCDKTEPSFANKIGNVFWVVVIFGAIGFLPQIYAICNPIKDITVRSHAPISIIKTNNVTYITYKDYKGYTCHEVNNTADFWNSTNIVVKYNVGKNIYGNEAKGGTRLCTE